MNFLTVRVIPIHETIHIHEVKVYHTSLNTQSPGSLRLLAVDVQWFSVSTSLLAVAESDNGNCSAPIPG